MDKISKMKNNLNYVDKFLFKNNYLNRCLVNCSDCCHDYFYASYLEFYLTLDALCELPYNLDYFYNQAVSNYDYFKRYFPLELKRLDPLYSNRLLSSVVNDFEEGEYINYLNLKPCIMLTNGLCSIYNVRPNTCRKYGTTICCEYLNNTDYRDDDYTNYHLYPLIENTLLISNDNTILKTFKYPLWFFYSYFFKKEFRPYVITTLNKLKSLSEYEFIKYINS